MRLVLDIENSTSPYEYSTGETDLSPFNPRNRLVSVGLKDVDSGDSEYLFFYHNDLDMEEAARNTPVLQKWINKADLVIGHNLKHDIAWLKECGFTFDHCKLWDTMFFEYVVARGRKVDLSLDGVAARRQLSTGGKLDIMGEYFKQGINTDAIPVDELERYGVQDVDVTTALFLDQQRRLEEDTSGRYEHMITAVTLMNDFLSVLIDMTIAGAAVDIPLLKEYEAQFTIERDELQRKLERQVQELMGDRPYSLSSYKDMSEVLYSRKPRDRNAWAELFNCGSESRGHVKKQKQIKLFSNNKFAAIVNRMDKVYKTKAEKCSVCKGKGYIYKETKDGTPYKRHPKCKQCDGTGVDYRYTGEIAGLKLRPINAHATANGFSASKDIIEAYSNDPTVPEHSVQFIKDLNKLNKLNTWIDTFLDGVYKYQHDGVLHASFNQCVTATGRLSCSRPNMQNQPKRDPDFLIRRIFVSRWADIGGKLVDADFGQLEFRIAALLSQCPSAIKAIEEGLDIHAVTRAFYAGELANKPPKEEIRPDITRQEAKADTFGPLYGKRTAWTKEFYERFPGIKSWHVRLMDEAVTTKETKSPSGRYYSFPDCRRFQSNDGELLVSGHTQIKNYSVQGFATGDMVLLVLIDIHKYLTERGAKSKLILQVHDSATVDAHPDEIDLVLDAFRFAFSNIYAHAKERFGIDVNVPLAFDLSIGDNWLDQEAVTV